MKFFKLIILLIFISVHLFAQSQTEEFKPVGKSIIQVFGNAGFDMDQERYDYNFTRAHLGYQYQFSPNWSAKVIIDRGRSTSVGEIKVTDSSGEELQVENSSKEGAHYSMFLKFASLELKVDQDLKLQAGAVLQNHYITQERFWGLRYVA